MTDKTYADFNSLTITGRLAHAELASYNGNTWLSVTLYTNLVEDDEDGAKVTFNTTNGLMSLFKKGYLPTGRLITVTGHLASFKQLIFDKKLGKTRQLKRPELHLTKAVVFDGGLGPAKKEGASTPSVDEAPEFAVADM